MCGIWAYIENGDNDISVYHKEDLAIYLSASDVVGCRGPDKIVQRIHTTHAFVFHRLAIHDLSVQGDQPFEFKFDDGTHIELMCNGEIYNYSELVTKYSFEMKSTSDCEVIGHLMYYYKFDMQKVLSVLRGEFAFIAHTKLSSGEKYLTIARDTFGVRPLYYGVTHNGIILSSLLGGITSVQNEFDQKIQGMHFPPGHYFHSEINDISLSATYFSSLLKDAFPHFKTIGCNFSKPENMEVYYKKITARFIHAVQTRLDSERNLGFLLSGGLDSSLIVAVATKLCKIDGPPIKTFSIGFDPAAPDLQFALKVATHLGTDHTPVIVDNAVAIEAIPTVIKALETFDITTIRASTPQYLLAKYIRENTDIKVILNGDGSDEVSMGYIYNYFAPDAATAHADSLRLLKEIHCYDGLRVDRTLGAHGLEARVPFLDIDYVEAYLNTPVELRLPSTKSGRMEKQLLRDAFYTLYPDILPKEIYYRKKEAFSDGVSTTKKSWFSILKEKAEKEGKTEGYWYKTIFDIEFPNQEHICPHYWMPQWTNATDPSARTLTNY
jgi:asparagine synthase (glutamine-hydrolysing)